MENGIRTVAFPSISTGVYSYPVDEAARVAIDAVRGFIAAHPDDLDMVKWVLFDQTTKSAYDKALSE